MTWTLFGFFLSAFLTSAFSSVAAMLRSKEKLETRFILTYFFNGGLMGTMLAGFWYTYFQQNPAILIAFCILFGIGGMTLWEFVLYWLKQGGLDISIKIGEKKNKEDNKSE